MHFLLEVKTVNDFIKRKNIVVHVCAIFRVIQPLLLCYTNTYHAHKIIKTFSLCSVQRKINFYGKVLTSRCIFLLGFDLDTLKKKRGENTSFSSQQFQSNHHTLCMILYSTVGQAVTKPYDCINSSLYGFFF